MRTVQIAELKNRLSAYLTMVRAGQEIIVCARKRPIARIVPLAVEMDDETAQLVAEGILSPPKAKWDPEEFFKWDPRIKVPKNIGKLLDRALALEREERDASAL